jgi:DNA-binding HxlR family transcriptional regulator
MSLKHLEKDGFIIRTAFAEVPLRVEYTLTEQGKSFCNKILELSEWVGFYFPTILNRRLKTDEGIKK